jgi:hypothetical protein
LALVTVVVGTVFGTVALTAPVFRTSLRSDGIGLWLTVCLRAFTSSASGVTYDQVRHVSLTVGWTGEGQGELFAVPYWNSTTRSPYIWNTVFSSGFNTDEGILEIKSKTVEFDTDHWKIYLWSFDNWEKEVHYRYTVTYSKP